MSDYGPKILIDAIEQRQADVRDILKDAKKTLDAKDARFRPKGWNDKSVVHVANWIIEEEDNSPSGLSKFEPELAERVFYDPDNPSRVDCFVGKVAKIGRIKEEEMNEIFLFSWEDIPGNDEVGLIKYIEHNLGIDLENIKIKIKHTDRTKQVSTVKRHISLKLNDEESEVNIEIDGIK
ncbi:MAG: hypothetical protein ABIH80_06275, partial [Methanobacteriota archaeon]